MKKAMTSAYSDYMTTGVANYNTSTSAETSFTSNYILVDESCTISVVDEIGKYSVFDIADWFLAKGVMTPKKLQKLCYYAQAWCYALKGYRLMDTDFQAWVHGPVSPALYERFKSFGYSGIKIANIPQFRIDEEDIALLEDVWATYGEKSGNELELLTHREAPWKEARLGYAPSDRCTVIIDPEVMKTYYRSIYTGE